MVLNYFFWWVLLISGCVLLMLIAGFIIGLITKKSDSPVTGFAVLILFIGYIVLYNVYTSKVYCINSRADWSRSYLIGSHTFNLKNGTAISLSSSSKFNYLVNNTDSLIICYENIYGYGYSTNSKNDHSESFPQQAVSRLDHRIDYFPDESLPSTISSSSWSHTRYNLNMRAPVQNQ